MSTIGNYTISTYADGHGTWHARIDFPHGAGNTEAGFRLIDNARAAARRAIRREIIARSNGDTLPPLRFEVVANREHGSGALASLTIAEAGVIEPMNRVQRLTFDFAKRENSSVNGNPAWSVWFKELDHSVRTSSDAGWSYEVSNIKEGTLLDVSFTDAGRIAYARTVR